jgi:hypothetical protein
VIVKPETVIGWHRAGFCLCWWWRSRPRGGRPKSTHEVLAERWAGSYRREILDQVIARTEQPLRRLIRDCVNYHQGDRLPDSLEEDAPNRRPVQRKPSPNAVVVSNARLGGLHHRYSWREAA